MKWYRLFWFQHPKETVKIREIEGRIKTDRKGSPYEEERETGKGEEEKEIGWKRIRKRHKNKSENKSEITIMIVDEKINTTLQKKEI